MRLRSPSSRAGATARRPTSRRRSEAEELMEQFEADIAAAESDVIKLTDEIAALNAELDSKKAEMASNTEDREKEKALYKKTHKDYGESVEATHNAKDVLNAQSGDVAQAMMFLQTL